MENGLGKCLTSTPAKALCFNANPRTRSRRLVGPQRPAPTLSGGEERGRQRETDTLELTARGGTCRGREEPRPAREVDAVTGRPGDLYSGGKSEPRELGTRKRRRRPEIRGSAGTAKGLALGWRQEGGVGREVIGGKQGPEETGREPGMLPGACLLGPVLLGCQSQSGYYISYYICVLNPHVHVLFM